MGDLFGGGEQTTTQQTDTRTRLNIDPQLEQIRGLAQRTLDRPAFTPTDLVVDPVTGERRVASELQQLRADPRLTQAATGGLLGLFGQGGVNPLQAEAAERFRQFGGGDPFQLRPEQQQSLEFALEDARNQALRAGAAAGAVRPGLGFSPRVAAAIARQTAPVSAQFRQQAIEDNLRRLQASAAGLGGLGATAQQALLGATQAAPGISGADLAQQLQALGGQFQGAQLERGFGQTALEEANQLAALRANEPLRRAQAALSVLSPAAAASGRTGTATTTQEVPGQGGKILGTVAGGLLGSIAGPLGASIGSNIGKNLFGGDEEETASANPFSGLADFGAFGLG